MINTSICARLPHRGSVCTLVEWTQALHQRPLVITSSAFRSRRKNSGLQAKIAWTEKGECLHSQLQSDQQRPTSTLVLMKCCPACVYVYPLNPQISSPHKCGPGTAPKVFKSTVLCLMVKQERRRYRKHFSEAKSEAINFFTQENVTDLHWSLGKSLPVCFIFYWWSTTTLNRWSDKSNYINKHPAHFITPTWQLIKA